MSRKQELYRDILTSALPFVRSGLQNVVHVPWWRMLPRRRRRFGRSYYEVAQLVHDLPVSILSEEFSEHDLWFLNVHARSFLERNDARTHTLYPVLARYIQELFQIVPERMKARLEWAGPTEDWSGVVFASRE